MIFHDRRSLIGSNNSIVDSRQSQYNTSIKNAVYEKYVLYLPREFRTIWKSSLQALSPLPSPSLTKPLALDINRSIPQPKSKQSAQFSNAPSSISSYALLI